MMVWMIHVGFSLGAILPQQMRVLFTMLIVCLHWTFQIHHHSLQDVKMQQCNVQKLCKMILSLMVQVKILNMFIQFHISSALVQDCGCAIKALNTFETCESPICNFKAYQTLVCFFIYYSSSTDKIVQQAGTFTQDFFFNS